MRRVPSWLFPESTRVGLLANPRAAQRLFLSSEAECRLCPAGRATANRGSSECAPCSGKHTSLDGNSAWLDYEACMFRSGYLLSQDEFDSLH